MNQSDCKSLYSIPADCKICRHISLVGTYPSAREELKPSTRKAMDVVYKLIDLNKNNKDKNRGIPLEKYLNVL